MHILEKNVFLHFKTFFTNNDFERRSVLFWVTEIGEIIGYSIWFFVKKLKNQFIWNEQQKKVSFNYAASVNIVYFLSVLPQFEQVKEVCLHAGHASVHVNSLWITFVRF